jgi:hypothetical protein
VLSDHDADLRKILAQMGFVSPVVISVNDQCTIIIFFVIESLRKNTVPREYSAQARNLKELRDLLTSCGSYDLIRYTA